MPNRTSLNLIHLPWLIYSASLGGAWQWPLPTFHQAVSTLDPALVKPKDFLNLSKRKEISLGFPRESRRTRSLLCYLLNNGRIPFPDDCKGFMYYHTHPRAAPLEGSLRFRLIKQSGSSTFDDGADLTLPSGMPWQAILPQLTGTGYSKIQDQLLHEGLITQTQVDRCLSIFGATGRRITASSTLFRLDQEFAVDFAGSIHLAIVGADALHKLAFPSVFFSNMDKARIWPWAGTCTALARWEPSTRPEDVKARRRILHLRITKIIEPVRCTVTGYTGRLLRPEEGALLTMCLPWETDPEPWAVDLDSDYQNSRSLRVLRDAAGLP
ncbi:hypothetical protein DFH06DRAFT_1105789 [Mycena polygramma]|nr:hypothetical protein DFH06DRAFT_1105789 [Mycena polygramma]